MTLEEKIRAAIVSPEGLQHLTLAPSDKGWQAAFRVRNRVTVDEQGRKIPNPTIGYRIAIDADPIAALMEVIGEPGEPAPDLDDDDLSLI